MKRESRSAEAEGDPWRGALPARRRPRGGRILSAAGALDCGTHWSVTEGKLRIGSVFSLVLKFAVLTHLEAEFGKSPIGRNVLLREIYKFVNWLIFKFGRQI